MLEDLEEDASLLDRVLEKENFSFSRIRVDTREEFVKALDTFSPDLILSDHALPQFNSIEALQIKEAKQMDIPFIIVTGTVSEEFAVSCLKKGADDYILKSNLSRMPSAIRHSLQERENRRVRKEQEKILENQNANLIKINKELDSFVYSISHNLRSPLASVIGLVNLASLEKDRSPETTANYFKMIGRSTLRLDDNLKAILEYSQNSRTDLQASKIDMEKIIDESYERLNYLKGWSGLEKQFTLNQLMPFYSDAYRLSVLLTNLLSNSIRYIDDKKSNQLIRIEVTISTEQAIIKVFDNGVGIHPDYLPKIFKMFYRATERSDGAGLGLYIVKEVIEKLKGTIDIKSEYGEWTKVFITVPNMKAGVEKLPGSPNNSMEKSRSIRFD